MSQKRPTVYIMDEQGSWTVHHSPFTLQAAQQAYDNKLQEVKTKKKGGVRLTASNGELLEEFVYREDEEGGITNRATKQMTLF